MVYAVDSGVGRIIIDSYEEIKMIDSISCELLLIKMKNDAVSRDDIRAAAEAFGAVTVDYSRESISFSVIKYSGSV